MIKYPNGMTKTTVVETKNKKKDVRKSHLGVDFEDLINESNQYYLSKNVASIYKKPTPIQIVKVEYPSRNKARITEAYYRMPSTTDYNGIYKGKYIDFEAKICHFNSFPFKNIYDHQIKHLETVQTMGGISFLIIEFSLHHEVFLLPTTDLVNLYNESLKDGRKSIPYEYFKEHAYQLKLGFNPRINYLDVVDILIEKANNNLG